VIADRRAPARGATAPRRRPSCARRLQGRTRPVPAARSLGFGPGCACQLQRSALRMARRPTPRRGPRGRQRPSATAGVSRPARPLSTRVPDPRRVARNRTAVAMPTTLSMVSRQSPRRYVATGSCWPATRQDSGVTSYRLVHGRSGPGVGDQLQRLNSSRSRPTCTTSPTTSSTSKPNGHCKYPDRLAAGEARRARNVGCVGRLSPSLKHVRRWIRAEPPVAAGTRAIPVGARFSAGHFQV
jgi:hypothetical protein